jgi:hypothetical protein
MLCMHVLGDWVAQVTKFYLVRLNMFSIITANFCLTKNVYQVMCAQHKVTCNWDFDTARQNYRSSVLNCYTSPF